MNTNTAIRLLAALTVLAGVTTAQAQITPLERFSDVSFDGSGLGNGAGGPDQYEETDSLTASFNEALSGFAVNVEPSDATNEGSWSVTQNSSIDDYGVSAMLAQSATVATDFGSPGIFNASEFDFSFTVVSTVDAELTGAVNGSSSLGAPDFARVSFKRDNVTLFSTSFGHAFPFQVTLEPGREYQLQVIVKGEAEFNASSFSSADAVLTLAEAPADSDGDGVTDDLDNCTLVFNPDQRDTNGDGIGNDCDADLNGDCTVNFGDVVLLKAAFTPRPYDADADFDGDGLVGFSDVAFMLSTFFNGANPGPGPSGAPNACTP